MSLETTLVIERNRRRIAEAEVLRLKRAQQVFLGQLSHAMRLPLYSQLGLTGLFEQEPCSGRQHEYVRLMQNNTENLLLALDDIVGLGRQTTAPGCPAISPGSLPGVNQG